MYMTRALLQCNYFAFGVGGLLRLSAELLADGSAAGCQPSRQLEPPANAEGEFFPEERTRRHAASRRCCDPSAKRSGRCIGATARSFGGVRLAVDEVVHHDAIP